MKSIKFSHNWNGKLDLRVFTTIRGWTSDKEKYYENLVGYDFEVLLKGKLKCIVELQKVEVFEFSDIPMGLKMMDTGHIEDIAGDIFSHFGLVALPNHKTIILTFLHKGDGKNTQLK
ncbi:MAG TPA: hypothetical protein ENH46_05550 [Candidatus Pacearchaeota archaeon]|nr:hypothetical protein [Candidatus Pacearchaeota archaeon]